MADNRQGAAPAPAPAQAPAKKPLPKKLIILVAAALALCASGAGAFLYLNKKPENADPQKKEAPRRLPNFVDLDQFTVNLAEKDQDRYMQIKFSLEVGSSEAENTIKEMMPALRSEILLVLGSRQAADLASRDGKEALANDLVAAANRALEHTAADRSVRAVRITQLIIQ